MEKKIYFRADNGNHIGNGHLFRCANIAEVFLRHGWKVEFLSRRHLGSLFPDNFPYPGHFIGDGLQDSVDVGPDYSTWLGCDEMTEVEDVLKYLTSPQVIFIDHYAYTSSMEARLKEAGHVLIALDDIKRTHYVDLLFDYFSGSSETTVRSRNIFNHEVRTGLEYMPINPVFPQHVRKIQANHIIDRVLLNLGTTSKLLYDKALTALLKIEHPFRELIVLSTHHFDIVDPKRKISFLKSTNQIHKLNLEVDFVIGASGVAMFERIVQQVPCVNVIVVDNQINIKDQFKDEDLHFFGVDLRTISESELIQYLSECFNHYLASGSSACGCLVSSGGAEKIFNQILPVYAWRP